MAIEGPTPVWMDTCPDDFFCHILGEAETGTCKRSCGDGSGQCFATAGCRGHDVGLAAQRCLLDPGEPLTDRSTCR